MSIVWLEKPRLGRAVPVEVLVCDLQAFAHGQVCLFPGPRSHFFLTSPLFPLPRDPLGQVPVLGPLQDPGSALILPLHLVLPLVPALVALPHLQPLSLKTLRQPACCLEDQLFPFRSLRTCLFTLPSFSRGSMPPPHFRSLGLLRNLTLLIVFYTLVTFLAGLLPLSFWCDLCLLS